MKILCTAAATNTAEKIDLVLCPYIQLLFLHLFCSWLCWVFIAAWHVGSSWTRDWTCVWTFTGRWIEPEIEPSLAGGFFTTEPRGKPRLICFCCCYLVDKSCPVLCNPLNCSQTDSSVHGISQARILEWIAVSYFGGSPQPRDGTWVSCLAGRFFNTVTPVGTATLGSPIQFF